MKKELNIKEVINLSEKEYNLLDKEDKEILENIYSKDGWESLAEKNPEKFEDFKNKLKNASISVKKPKKAISLRVNEEDILEIKKIAEKQGLPYQTFISSILHKIATNQIKI